MGLLKTVRYLNNEDMTARIGRSIIRYRGKHVWAVAHSLNDIGDLHIDLTDLYSGKTYEKVHSSDEEVDVSAFPVGYINTKDKALFVARMPARIRRQGLCQENAVYYQEEGRVNNVRNDVLRSKLFFEMLNEDYPKIDNIIKNLTHNKGDDPSRIAFSKRLALERDEIGLIRLIYMIKPVAVYEPRSKQFKITERFAHYAPILMGHGVNVEVA